MHTARRRVREWIAIRSRMAMRMAMSMRISMAMCMSMCMSMLRAAMSMNMWNLWHGRLDLHHSSRQAVFLDRHAHMTPISSLSSIALILAHAAFNADSCVAASTAWTLAIAALLALAAALASWLRREVFLIWCVCERSDRRLAGLCWERGWRDRRLARRRAINGLLALGLVG